MGGAAFTKISPGGSQRGHRHPRGPDDPDPGVPVCLGRGAADHHRSSRCRPVQPRGHPALARHDAAQRRSRTGRPDRARRRHRLRAVHRQPAPQGAAARCRPARRDHHGDEHLRAGRALRGRHRHRRAAGPGHPQRRLPDRAGHRRRGDRIPDRHGRGDPAPGAAGHDGTTCAAQVRARRDRVAGTGRRRPGAGCRACPPGRLGTVGAAGRTPAGRGRGAGRRGARRAGRAGPGDAAGRRGRQQRPGRDECPQLLRHHGGCVRQGLRRPAAARRPDPGQPGPDGVDHPRQASCPR